MSRTLIGRGPTCSLRIDDSAVSREHAVLFWSEGVWAIKDLGSRNGTIVDGMRLTTGISVTLRPGVEIKFGDEGVAYQLVDATAPQAFAVAPDQTEVRAEGGLLILPDPDRPEVTIFKSQDSVWVCEAGNTVTPLDEWQTVAVDGEVWHVHVPATLEVTLDAVSLKASSPSLANMRMVFKVSQDEEYAQLSVQGRGGSVELKPRAFTYTLLTLGRLRVKDAESGVSPAEQGWVHQDDLAAMLACDRSVLNVHVCRARRQLAQAGIVGAAEVVERRSGTGQLRIGSSSVVVESF